MVFFAKYKGSQGDAFIGEGRGVNRMKLDILLMGGGQVPGESTYHSR